MDNLQKKGPKKPKRIRSAYTTDQVNSLETEFKNSPYLDPDRRRVIAAAFNITDKAVKVWFQNRRMKEKRDREEIKEQEMSCLSLNNQVISVPSGNEQPQSLPIYINLNQGYNDHNTETNSFMEGQLNNMYVPSGSGNEQTRSLPILPNCIETYTSTCSITRQMVQVESKGSTEKVTAPVSQSEVTTAKVINSVFEKTSQSNADKTSTELPIDLCKKHKSEFFAESSFRKESDNVKTMEKPMSVGFAEQTTPVNLSPIRNKNISATGHQQSLPESASSIPGFVSLVPTVPPFQSQPYLPSGVIWKPVSVMPVVPSRSSTFPVPSNPMLNISSGHNHFANRPCNKCDCHAKQAMPQIPFSFPQQSPNTQYIITAVPFLPPAPKL